jgi:hypothetical protein
MASKNETRQLRVAQTHLTIPVAEELWKIIGPTAKPAMGICALGSFRMGAAFSRYEFDEEAKGTPVPEVVRDEVSKFIEKLTEDITQAIYLQRISDFNMRLPGDSALSKVLADSIIVPGAPYRPVSASELNYALEGRVMAWEEAPTLYPWLYIQQVRRTSPSRVQKENVRTLVGKNRLFRSKYRPETAT